MASKRATIVIVHGAWVGGWRWRGVADVLIDRGHHIFTPTLTGLGEREHLTHPGVNVSLHARDVANVIRFERLENILLVGHSYGGMPISVAAELVPEGIIQSIMYMDAFFPEDGQCLNDLVPGPPHVPTGEGSYLVDPPRANLVGFNTHMDAAARAAYEERRMPQSVHCFSEKVRLTGAPKGAKTYVPPPATRTTPSHQSPMPASAGWRGKRCPTRLRRGDAGDGT
jgi:pimeloyl-ACP methyl ester carboxylesterase